jgi:hypothetical protein
MTMTSIPASSHDLIASIYLSGEYGASSGSTLYSQRFEYSSHDQFSESMRTIFDQSHTIQYAIRSAEYVFPDPDGPENHMRNLACLRSAFRSFIWDFLIRFKILDDTNHLFCLCLRHGIIDVILESFECVDSSEIVVFEDVH